MRKHLIAMFQNNFLQPFPTVKVIAGIIIDNIYDVRHSNLVISKNLINEFKNIDINRLKILKDKFLAREAKNLYANYAVNEDGSTTKAQLKIPKKDSENRKQIKKLIRKQCNDDDILQKVKIAEKRMKVCMNKRKLENGNVTDVSKKIKVEMNDYDDISSAELENEIQKSNSMKLKHYKTLQRKFYEGIHNDAIIKQDFDENIISIYSLGEINF